LATLALLAFGFHVPWFIVVPLGCVVPLLYLAGAVYASRALPEFEREFNRRTMRGDVAGLWTLYRDARWLRWVAPTYRMRSKLGLILSLRGEHRNADRVLDEAWVLAPKHRRAELLGPLARTKYAVGDHEALGALIDRHFVGGTAAISAGTPSTKRMFAVFDPTTLPKANVGAPSRTA
jgi:hypothetical protein